MYSYGILKCGEEQFSKLDREDIVAYRKQDYSYDILISDREGLAKKFPKANIETVTIDEIMVLFIKGERK